MKCKGKTKAGNPCSYQARKGSSYCGYHSPSRKKKKPTVKKTINKPRAKKLDISKMSLDEKIRLASSEKTPIQTLIALDKSLTRSDLTELIYVRDLLLKNRAYKASIGWEKWLKEFRSHEKYKQISIEYSKLTYNQKVIIASDPTISLDLLAFLAKDNDSNIRFNIARNPKTPASVLNILAKDKNDRVRLEVAKNPKTPVNVLKLLAKDKDEVVRSSVANNPKTPVNVLKLLAKDNVSNIRFNIARDPKTPASILSILSKDIEGYIRLEVAGHPKTPASILSLLAKDKDLNVRIQVAGHPKTPVSVLEFLAKDKDYYVRYEVAKNPNYNKP